MSEHNNMDLTPEERRMQKSVRNLGEVRADDAFREKLRRQFVSGELASGTPEEDPGETPTPDTSDIIDLPTRSRRFKRALRVLPAIAAVLVVVIFSDRSPDWELEDVRGTGTVTVNNVTVDAADRGAVANLIVPDAQITVPEGVQLDIVLDGVLVVGVAGPADFTLPTNPSKDPYVYEATIREGEFRLKTGPDFAGRDALLLTTEGRVEVTGTSLAVYKNTDVTCVCILEGTALIGKDQDHLDAVAEGMRKVMFADGRDPVIIPIEPGHKDGLLEFEDYNEDTFK